ncbi:DUF262 domain-containing protein [Dickeya lacustris]|uniref:DUF262 domain-containing protein n=1 Tax=Dickeya lacustris TaxID=2259638 RepID=A0ABY8G5D7_9GAMM|nr:DUF262 domain-containing protein [Dickeya lacustris]WFN55135.1 DUF262 domain-containing protein [Dickeya lacustris]
MDILKRDSNSINIASFWEGYNLKKFNFEPPYQRDSVWNEEKQSFFIDSILRNYPIPPIFLHQKIDDETGKILFEVVDGKQRLTAIVSFINGTISSASEEDDDILTGIYFNDLSNDNLAEVKKRFWRYQMPIEYIDTEDEKMINSIFDRLNRNGEKLNGQELRNAKYHDKSFYKNIVNKSMVQYWSKLLIDLDKKRMEDKEFISELIFSVLENDVLGANQETIDALYEKYCTKEDDETMPAFHEFDEISDFLEGMSINFSEYKASGVSHIYAFFCYSRHCIKNNIPALKAKKNLEDFLITLWTPESKEYETIRKDYRKTMSSSTKSKSQRYKRVDALISLLR